eukprot:INCI3402.2.p1 GENE.INCI3402.2~~INCI3402.2.p1  ORF type:complete len:455 (-),score=74.16 INCI3402.2:85-1338(-)
MQADVDELITKFRVKIDKLRQRVIDIVPQDDPQYDDLFYLRYVLSFKAKTTKCVEPIRFTVDYRTKHKDIFEKIYAEGVNAVPHHIEAMRFNCTGMSGTLPTGEPIWVVRTGHSMQTQLMNTLSKEQVQEWLTLSKEVQWHICDTHTRKTRKLTKMITIIDFQGYSMGASDRRFFKALGDSSKASAKCYPQLLGKTVIVNAPSFFRWMFKVFSVFQPKSSIEKMAICPVKHSAEKSAQDCPWLSRLQGVGSVPPFLGGTGKLPAELEPFHSRADALTPLSIPARRAADPVTLDVPGGTVVQWEVIVKAYGVNLSFSYTTASNATPKPIDVEGSEGGVLKIQSDNGLTSGTFVMPEDGLLSVLFDNRHSTFRAKNVEYRIDVVAPEGDDVPLPTAEEIDAAPTANGGSAAPALPVAAQ